MLFGLWSFGGFWIAISIVWSKIFPAFPIMGYQVILMPRLSTHQVFGISGFLLRRSEYFRHSNFLHAGPKYSWLFWIFNATSTLCVIVSITGSRIFWLLIIGFQIFFKVLISHNRVSIIFSSVQLWGSR